MLNEYPWKGHEVVCLPEAPLISIHLCLKGSMQKQQPKQALWMKQCQRKGWWKLEVENAEVTRAEQASSEWRGGGGVGGWRCPQTLELWGGRGYRALEMSQGWKGAIQGAEAIRPHLSSCI